MNNVTTGFPLILVPPLSLDLVAPAMPAEPYPGIPIDPVVATRHDGDPRAACPSGAVVMAFYAGGAIEEFDDALTF